MDWDEPPRNTGGQKGAALPIGQDLSDSLDAGLAVFGIGVGATPLPLPQAFNFQDAFDLAESLRRTLPGIESVEAQELDALLGECERLLKELLDKIKDKSKKISLADLEKVAKNPKSSPAFADYLNMVTLLNYTQERFAAALAPREATTQSADEEYETESWRSYEKEKSDARAAAEKKDKEAQWALGKEKPETKKSAGYAVVANVQEKDPNAAREDVDDPNILGSYPFPHDGKHQPVPKLMGYAEKIILKTLCTETSGKNEDAALYKTNLAKTVIQWENRARKYGLLCAGNFTIVHKFAFVIGADQGELTSCIRIDGDHGHPISEKLGKTSFISYIAREFEAIAELAATDVPAAKKRLDVVRAYLERIGESAQGYLGRLPKSVQQ